MTARPVEKLAFVLPGGGSLGAVQVGMLRALTEHGIKPDILVGASVGALNSAFFAANSDRAGVDALERVWRSLRRQDVFQSGIVQLVQRLWRGDGGFGNAGLRALIERSLPYENIEDAPIPLHILAADFMSGKPVVLSNGRACEAIMASAAIPAAFPPVKVGEHFLVDGALATKTPIRIAAEMGCTRIVLLPVSFACAMTEPPQGTVAKAMHSLNLLVVRHLLSDVELLGSSVEISIVPPLCPLSTSPFDFSHTGALIDRAYDQTSRWIADGRHHSCELPRAIFPHSH